MRFPSTPCSFIYSTLLFDSLYLKPHRFIARNMTSGFVHEDEKLIKQKGVDNVNTTIFGKIINGTAPCDKVYEDDKILAFHDIAPQAPFHVLVVPKVRDGLTRLGNAEERHKNILGHMLVKVAEIAKQENLDDFRVVINNGEDAVQAVYHLHIHILGKRKFNWPPG